MSDWTFSSNSIIRPYRSGRGGAETVMDFQESTVAASSGLIRYGDIVMLDVSVATSAHRVVKASTIGHPVLESVFLGVSLQDSTSDGSTTGLGTATNRRLLVCLAGASQEFLFPTRLSTGGNFVAGDTSVGRSIAIGYDSTLHRFYADPGKSTAGDARLYVTASPYNGDSNGPLVCRFHSTALNVLCGTK